VTEHPDFVASGPGSREAPGNLTVLLLDDHAVMLESVREIIETDDTLTVVGTASRITDAVLLAKQTVIIRDCKLPKAIGDEVDVLKCSLSV